MTSVVDHSSRVPSLPLGSLNLRPVVHSAEKKIVAAHRAGELRGIAVMTTLFNVVYWGVILTDSCHPLSLSKVVIGLISFLAAAHAFRTAYKIHSVYLREFPLHRFVDAEI